LYLDEVEGYPRSPRGVAVNDEETQKGRLLLIHPTNFLALLGSGFLSKTEQGV
jgi:hypothetical protein